MTMCESNNSVERNSLWMLITGGVFGVITLLFFMAVVLMSIYGREVPSGSRFLVVIVMSFGVALASGFIGGHVAGQLTSATSNKPFPGVWKVTVGGGIAAFFIALALGSYLYVREKPDSSEGERNVDSIRNSINNTIADFNRISEEGEKPRRRVLSEAPIFATLLSSIDEGDLRAEWRIMKYEYAGIAYTMAAYCAPASQKSEYAEKALSSLNAGIAIIEGMKAGKEKSDTSKSRLFQWLSGETNRIRFYKSLCEVVEQESKGGQDYSRAVATMRSVDPVYLAEYVHDLENDIYLKRIWSDVKDLLDWHATTEKRDQSKAVDGLHQDEANLRDNEVRDFQEAIASIRKTLSSVSDNADTNRPLMLVSQESQDNLVILLDPQKSSVSESLSIGRRGPVEFPAGGGGPSAYSTDYAPPLFPSGGDGPPVKVD